MLKLLVCDGKPQPIPDEVIIALHQRIQQLNEQGGLSTHTFQPGDKVMIKSGPLRGLAAIFTGPTTPGERVRILFDFMGQPQEMQINVADLEDSTPRPHHRLERRTRGKGRTIGRNRSEQLRTN